ncbi:MAG: DUF2309 domain-containing protein [Nakamurella sp.]
MTGTPVERARLRSDVAVAARILPMNWPIDTFIAVNPAAGFEDRSFGTAVADIGEQLGARGLPERSLFRAAYAANRITDVDLAAALGRRYPDTVGGPPIHLGPRRSDGSPLWVDPTDLLLADLQLATAAAPPTRRTLMLSERIAPTVADSVDAHTAHWCAAFLDTGQAGWPMPSGETGFFQAWRDLAPRDPRLPTTSRRRIRALPADSDAAALTALTDLGIPPDQHRSYLQAHLSRLPGWAAHVRWRAEHTVGIDLVDYLAMRLVYESTLLAEHTDAHRDGYVHETARPGAVPGWPSEGQRARDAAAALGADTVPVDDLGRAGATLATMPPADRDLVWLEAYEFHYRDRLLRSLPVVTSGETGPLRRPAAQLICCIDARSEGLRRHLESRGQYETFGFAGFFAVAIRYQDLAGGAAADLCPVLIAPRNSITEQPMAGTEDRAARLVAGRRALAGTQDAFHAAKNDMTAPFALAETAGWIAGPVAAAKTLTAGRYGTLRDRFRRRVAPDAPTTLNVLVGVAPEERALLAEAALQMMGLTHRFARIIVLCGHGSTTENNPFQAALDCGACGGHRGAPNARTAAAILNGTDVRDHLNRQGINVPADSWFVAAEHDTALDRVTVLDRHLIPSQYHAEIDDLVADLAAAGGSLAAERAATLPGAPPLPTPEAATAHVRGRSTDWAQVFPEWGLAGNAAFIIGPRSMSAGTDLGRRTFLHSYDADVDTDDTALETIMTAPLVVAQWINSQYYFSTVDPEVFGAGSKTIHNVVGGIGVLSGHNGDLQLGLPWQSIGNGDTLIHEPLRLFTLVQAPLERIERIIHRNTVLQHLFNHDWVALAARTTSDSAWQRYTPDGWQPWTTPEVSPT